MKADDTDAAAVDLLELRNTRRHESERKSQQSCCRKHRRCVIACTVFLSGILLVFAVLLVTSLIMLKTSTKEYQIANSTEAVNVSISVTKPQTMTISATPPYHICGGYAKVHAVFTHECTLENGRCRLTREKQGALQIVFTAARNISAGKFVVCAKGDATMTNLLGCQQKVLANDDICTGFNLQCPLLANSTQVFQAFDKVSEADNPLLKVMKDIHAVFNHKILDQDGKRVLCVDIPVIF